MDWDAEDSLASGERSGLRDGRGGEREVRDGWRAARGDGRDPRGDVRDPRGDGRQGRRPLEERLEGWMSRGRELVDGVSGTRPGSRGPGRAGERPGSSGRSGLDGLGRWVEGRLDWLLDDREDWREPWQEEDREPVPGRSLPPPLRTRPPLEAISRRAAPSAPPDGGEGSRNPEPSPEEWPDPDAFSVPHWRREPSPRPPVTNPLADPSAAPSPPGRPLPRSTRRR